MYQRILLMWWYKLSVEFSPSLFDHLEVARKCHQPFPIMLPFQDTAFSLKCLLIGNTLTYFNCYPLQLTIKKITSHFCITHTSNFALWILSTWTRVECCNNASHQCLSETWKNESILSINLHLLSKMSAVKGIIDSSMHNNIFILSLSCDKVY